MAISSIKERFRWPGSGAVPSVPETTGAETDTAREPNALRRFWGKLGPGLITGASDDDPSGIGTYSMAGAAFGYSMLWTATVTFPLMAAVQFICAKIGLVTGMGLAGVLRRHYSPALLYLAVGALLLANTLNAGADIGAVAEGIAVLLPVHPLVLIVPVGLLVLALQIWGSYRLIASIFKWLTLVLFSYIGAALFARPDWFAVIKATVVPTIHLDSKFLATLVAVLGTTISPYLFFWQASQEVEEKKGRRKKGSGTTDATLRYAAWDVSIGMFFSNLVMYFVILASAATLHEAGRTHIETATQAAEALRPLAGPAATLLFAIGLIGTGLLTVPILTTSAAYAVAEAFGWKNGLNKAPERARGFYAVIVAATLAGLAMNFLGINIVAALYWTAVINGVLAPPLLVLILLIGANPAIMGKRTNGAGLNFLGWVTAIAMFAAAIGMFCT